MGSWASQSRNASPARLSFRGALCSRVRSNADEDPRRLCQGAICFSDLVLEVGPFQKLVASLRGEGKGRLLLVGVKKQVSLLQGLLYLELVFQEDEWCFYTFYT